MANCPTAMKIEVDGYIAIMLAPTCHDVRMCLWLGSTCTDLRTESEVTKHSDDLVNTNSRADRCAYDEVHATLRIVDQLIVDREELHSSA